MGPNWSPSPAPTGAARPRCSTTCTPISPCLRARQQVQAASAITTTSSSRENEKDLVWALDERSYRSQIVIRLNGRRRTEAFLFVLSDTGAWRPVILEGSTVSDGKVDTYTRCVEHLCGSADTFFTSVFNGRPGQAPARRLPQRGKSRHCWPTCWAGSTSANWAARLAIRPSS